jgi:hypothetical protein
MTPDEVVEAPILLAAGPTLIPGELAPNVGHRTDESIDVPHIKPGYRDFIPANEPGGVSAGEVIACPREIADGTRINPEFNRNLLASDFR